MSSVSPYSASTTAASPRDLQPSQGVAASPTPQDAHKPASSTRVTLGHAPSPDYTDRIQRRTRVNVEAMLAGSGHAFHAAGLSSALPGASVAASQLTYSISPQVGAASSLDGDGGAASDQQQQAAMRAMVYLSAMMRVRFVEVAMGGQISFGGGVLPADSGGGGGGGAVDAPASSPVQAAGAAAAAPAPAPRASPPPVTTTGMGPL